MNDRTEETTYPKGISGEVLTTIPADTPAPSMLPEFRDCTVEGFEDEPRGVWGAELEDAGIGVSVEMWLRIEGDVMTVSPAYAGFTSEVDCVEYDADQAAALSRLMARASEMVTAANTTVLALAAAAVGS